MKCTHICCNIIVFLWFEDILCFYGSKIYCVSTKLLIVYTKSISFFPLVHGNTGLNGYILVLDVPPPSFSLYPKSLGVYP